MATQYFEAEGYDWQLAHEDQAVELKEAIEQRDALKRALDASVKTNMGLIEQRDDARHVARLLHAKDLSEGETCDPFEDEKEEAEGVAQVTITSEPGFKSSLTSHQRYEDELPRPETQPVRPRQYTKLLPRIGDQFGHLTITGEVFYKNRIRYAPCRCVCGKTTEVRVKLLYSGRSQSCRCKGSQHKAERQIWGAMIRRCTNPASDNYERYGGRGISVCPEWMDFERFIADMGPRPTMDHSIERIDNQTGYGPGNCRWATRKEQQNNRRNSRLIEFQGRTQTVAEWSRELGINADTIGGRLDRGWTPERALTEPVHVSGRWPETTSAITGQPPYEDELPLDEWIVATCPDCGGPVVNNLYYIGGRGYVSFNECWGSLGSHKPATCQYRRAV